MNAMSAEYFEALRAATGLLRHVCGYEYLHNDSEAFRRERASEADTILAARLEAQLRALNPNLSESALRRGLQVLNQTSQQSLVLTNQQTHAVLMNRAATGGAARYFDFERVEQNNFLLVEQFRVLDASARRTIDLALFVNGIPLGLIAIAPENSKEGLQAALRQLAQLQHPNAAARLFYATPVLLAAQKDFSAVGAASADERGFQPWDDPFPLDWEAARARLRQIPNRESDLPTAQDLALAGLFMPSTLLDLVSNFILFDHSSHGFTAKLAWRHQYQAVRRAVAQLMQAADDAALSKKSGWIWHPGNSGKTHTLVWLACQLRMLPALAARTLMIFTDCARQRELMRAALQQYGAPAPREIVERNSLPQSLRRANGTTFLLSVADFRQTILDAEERQPATPVSEAAPLILIDEIHRPEDRAFVTELKSAFPNACLIGLTAYPRLEEKPEPPVHALSLAMAQRRDYLLPAKFEIRLPRLHLQTEKNASVAALQAEAVAQRIASIAEDLRAHFLEEIRVNGSKAILWANNAAAAAQYYHALERFMPGQAAVLMPKPNEKELLKLYRQFEEATEIVSRFCDPQNELALLIVAGPMTPDLRATALQAVYVDRELRDYELLQAMAMTQMPGATHKHFGLLVDYYGMIKTRAQELAQFDFQQTGEVLTPRYSEDDFEELRLWRRELRAIFKSYPEADNFESWLFTLEPAGSRHAFQRTWLGFVKTLDQLLPRVREENTSMQEALWFDRVRQEAAAFYFDQALAKAQGSKKVRQSLEALAREQGATRVREMARIDSEAFMQEVETLSSLQAKALRLQYALLEEIRQNLERDPIFYQTLQQRVTKIIVERQNHQIDEETALQRLREEVLRLRAGAFALDEETQLTPEAQAYWRVLARYLAPRENERSHLEELAASLVAALVPDTQVIEWTLKEDLQREMRRKIKHLLRDVNCPADLLEPLTSALMQLTHGRYGGGK